MAMVDGTRVCAIVPAAGAGARMGRTAAASKALLTLGGVPVVVRTLQPFEAAVEVDDIVLVLRPADIPVVRSLLEGAGINKVRELITGGAERQDSVRLGFSTRTAGAAGIVVVHDAVRPLVTAELIGRVIGSAARSGAAVAAVRPKDTVKIEKEGGFDTPDRARCWLAQTPQAFRRELFARAIRQAAGDGFLGTDDVTLVTAWCGGIPGGRIL